MTRRSYKQYCAIAHALDVLGERWTLLILRDLMLGPLRYTELQSRLEGLGSNLLAKRLKMLEQEGIVERRPLGEDTQGFAYALTERGEAVRPVLRSLGVWGMEELERKRSEERFHGYYALWYLRGMFRYQSSEGMERRWELTIDEQPYRVLLQAKRLQMERGELGGEADLRIWVSSAALEQLFEGQISCASFWDRAEVLEGSAQAADEFRALLKDPQFFEEGDES